MERRDIEVLLVLADELHFARTAERLRLSPAAVSQTIGKLERRFGASLFTRTTRRVELTPLGRQLVDDLRPAHQQVSAAIARASAVGHGRAGRLQVGYMSAAVGELVLVLADTLTAVTPDCEVHVRETALADLCGPLRRGEVDISVLPLPVVEPDLIVGPVLLSESALLAMPNDHPLAQRRQIETADLADETMLFVQGLPQYWIDAHLPVPAHGASPRVITLAGFQETLAHIAAGRGLAIVGEQTPRLYPRPGLAYASLEPAHSYDYALTWRAQDLSGPAQAFARLAYDRAG
jgi:DNA-binding transcriptional LysR family regulator